MTTRSDRYLMARRMVDMYRHDPEQRAYWEDKARRYALALEPIEFPEPKRYRMPVGRLSMPRAPEWMCK